MKENKFRAWDKKFNKMIGVGGIQDLFSIRSDGIPSNENYVLMQFTGLLDKNGKERYYKDIIRRKTGYIFVEEPRFYHLGPSGSAMAYGYDYHPGDEVIGNIYENPELVK